MPLPPAPSSEPYVAVIAGAGRGRLVAEHLTHLGVPAHLVASPTVAGDVVRAAALVLLDADLHPDSLVHALALAETAGVPVVLDPVSATRARTVVLGRHPVHTVMAGPDELAALTGLATITEQEIDEAVEALLERDVQVVWVRRGELGSLLGLAGRRGTIALATDAHPADPARALAAYCRSLLDGAEPLGAATILGERR